MPLATDNNLVSAFGRFSGGRDAGSALEFREALGSASDEEKQELKTLLESESPESGETLPEIVTLREDIAAYQKLKENIAIGEQKLRDFPQEYEEAARKLTESLVNNKSNEPGNINLTDKRNLLRSTTADAEKGDEILLGLLDGLDKNRKELESYNKDLEKIDGQIRSIVLILAGMNLTDETLSQIKNIAEPLDDMDGIKGLLLTLPVQQRLISRRELQKEPSLSSNEPVLPAPASAEASVQSEPATNTFGVEEMRVEKAEDSSFAVDSDNGPEAKIDKMLGEKSGGFMTDAEADKVGKEGIKEGVAIADPDKDEIDRKAIKDSRIAEYNFVPGLEKKPEAIVSSAAELNNTKDQSTELIQDLDGASDGPSKPEDSKPEEPVKIEVPTYSDPIGMVKVKPDGTEDVIKTKDSDHEPNTPVIENPIAGGAARIKEIQELIGGKRKVQPVEKIHVSEEKKLEVRKKLKEVTAREASAAFSKDTITEPAPVKPSIEDELLRDVPGDVAGIESASIEESKGGGEPSGEVQAETVMSTENAAVKPSESEPVAVQPAPAEQPRNPSENNATVVNSQPDQQEQPVKSVEPEEKVSAFNRLQKALKVFGKNPDSSGAAKLVEIQKANKTKIESK